MEQKIILGVVGVLVIAAVGIFLVAPSPTPSGTTVPTGKYDEFATCLKDSGTTFFGAWWCPHCRDQKTLFGSSAELLPYVECSTPDGNAQLQVCKDAGVSSYPTWEFPNGERQTGEIPLATLSEKTGCVLPDAPAQAATVEVGDSSNAEVTPSFEIIPSTE